MGRALAAEAECRVTATHTAHVWCVSIILSRYRVHCRSPTSLPPCCESCRRWAVRPNKSPWAGRAPRALRTEPMLVSSAAVAIPSCSHGGAESDGTLRLGESSQPPLCCPRTTTPRSMSVAPRLSPMARTTSDMQRLSDAPHMPRFTRQRMAWCTRRGLHVDRNRLRAAGTGALLAYGDVC